MARMGIRGTAVDDDEPMANEADQGVTAELEAAMQRGDRSRELLAQANGLARRFYRRMGNVRPEGYRFDRATHPQEQMCWLMACDAIDELFGTDMEDVRAEVEGE